MCGRFVRSSPVSLVCEAFNIQQASIEIAPSYNISPSQEIVIINNKGTKQLIQCRWGFLPSPAKDASMGSRMINARAETVALKPTFKSAFKKQRCLVIADGFYEWRKINNKKTPVYIHLKSGRPFGFAGLYNPWTSPEGERICTCTIITTSANELLEPIHNRMPVIISRDKEDLWLNPFEQDQNVLLELLKPYPSAEMEIYEVSSNVNSPKYNSPDAINPVFRRP